MACPRGVAWGHAETIDLLAIFADGRVQRSLKDCRRNREVFEEISRKMADKGYTRSWQECRNRTKSLRHLYKKAQRHNNTSGNAPYQCPFYRELHGIYSDDRSINPLIVLDSLELNVSAPRVAEASVNEEVTLHLTLVPESQTSVESLPLLPVSGTLPRDASDANSGVQASGMQGAGEDSAEDDEGLSGGGTNEENEEPADNIARPNVDPGARLCDLTADQRNAVTIYRRRRVGALQRVGERIMEQAEQHHQEDMEARRVELRSQEQSTDRILAVLRDAVDEERAIRQELAQTREMLGRMFEQNNNCLQRLTEAFIESVSGRHTVSTASQNDGQNDEVRCAIEERNIDVIIGRDPSRQQTALERRITSLERRMRIVGGMYPRSRNFQQRMNDVLQLAFVRVIAIETLNIVPIIP